MQNTPHRFQKTLTKSAPSKAATAPASSLDFDKLSYWSEGWLVDCEVRQHSASTLAIRRRILTGLLWFLRREEITCCGTPELRRFFAYIVHGHTDEGGRWGNPQQTRPVRPRTIDTYHGHLRTFFQWTLAQGGLGINPMNLLTAPVCRADQIQPFTPDQLQSLLIASRKTQNPRRDEAIVMLLLDTGIRASELCGLKQKDLDLSEKRILVLGKGNKRRSIYFGQRATKVLWMYLRDKEVLAEAPLFPSERATEKGNHLGRFGLWGMIERIGESAGVANVRCSPHTFRHTFAISFLRSGGQAFALKEIMGHTDLKMTLKYVSFAEADIASQRRHSPADQLSGSLSGRPQVWTKGKVIGEQGQGGKTEKEGKAEVPSLPKPQPKKITQSKLTEDQVRAIKARLAVQDGQSKSERRVEIARAFGVSAAAVKEIDLGYSWRHIE